MAVRRCDAEANGWRAQPRAEIQSGCKRPDAPCPRTPWASPTRLPVAAAALLRGLSGWGLIFRRRPADLRAQPDKVEADVLGGGNGRSGSYQANRVNRTCASSPTWPAWRRPRVSGLTRRRVRAPRRRSTRTGPSGCSETLSCAEHRACIEDVSTMPSLYAGELQ